MSKQIQLKNGEEKVYPNPFFPVGAIYMSVSSVNPSTYFGGTWERWGQGRVVVSLNEGDGDFNISEKTGGAKTHTLINNEVPRETGSFIMHAAASATNIHHCDGVFKENYTAPRYVSTLSSENAGATSIGTVGFDNGGGNGPHNNLQPYITCYMWRRTA